MIITKTPYRISLFGGSTDYHSYYSLYESLLIGFTIDKYCYVACRKTPNILPYLSKITYSNSETVDDNAKIQHPAVRGCLEFLGINYGVEMLHMGDLPAQTGTGSSSSFVVGLLKAINYINKNSINKYDLANAAIYVERHLLGESGGIQDQIWAAYGGFNSIHIEKNGEFEVKPLPVSEKLKDQFLKRSFLLYTGKTRKSFEIAASHERRGAEEEKHKIKEIAHEAYNCFTGSDIDCIGALLHESWERKRKISDLVCPPDISAIYTDLQDLGMIGGKLLGSGGSGFIFGIADSISSSIDIKRQYKCIDWNFSNDGAKLIDNV
jgi:D-glycero-alpha-D-manno-heptose-7-phosphate kinase